MKASAKYWAIAGLTAAAEVVEYLQHNPTLNETTLLGAITLVIGLAVHDLEGDTASPASG